MTQPTTKNLSQTLEIPSHHQNTKSHFPKAILSVSREEFDALELTVKQGLTEKQTKLPKDLTDICSLSGRRARLILVVYPILMELQFSMTMA